MMTSLLELVIYHVVKSPDRFAQEVLSYQKQQKMEHG